MHVPYIVYYYMYTIFYCGLSQNIHFMHIAPTTVLNKLSIYVIFKFIFYEIVG